MSKENISFGSHSHHHENFQELTAAQISDEIDNSFQLFREHEYRRHAGPVAAARRALPAALFHAEPDDRRL